MGSSPIHTADKCPGDISGALAVSDLCYICVTFEKGAQSIFSGERHRLKPLGIFPRHYGRANSPTIRSIADSRNVVSAVTQILSEFIAPGICRLLLFLKATDGGFFHVLAGECNLQGGVEDISNDRLGHVARCTLRIQYADGGFANYGRASFGYT